MTSSVTGATGTTGTGSSVPSPTSPTLVQNAFGMSPDQFLQLLVAEMTTQDPLNPVDNTSFMQQMVGLQNIQNSIALTTTLNSLQNFMELSSGSAMIGKTVSGQDASGNPVQGTVSSVVLQNGTVNVTVGSQTLPLTSVTQING